MSVISINWEVFILKKILMAALSLVMMMLLTACGPDDAKNNNPNPPEQAQNTSETAAKAEATPANPETQTPETPPAPTTKLLVAYFSRPGDNYEVGVIEKGNTKILAEMIAEKTGADLFEIKTVREYPAGYRECTEVAKQEQVENARPELVSLVENLQNYNVIFLGYPIWWSDFPMAIYTFLEKQDFNGKTIIPFCTSAGNYMTGKESQIPQFAKGSIISQGLGIKGKDCQEDIPSVKERVDYWINGLGY